MQYQKRFGAATIIALALATALGGCTSTSTSTSTNGNGNAPNGAPSDIAEYLTCLTSNGVNLPELNGSAGPGARPSGAPSPGLPLSGTTVPSAAGPGGPGDIFGSTAPSGVDQAIWDKALAACQSVKPSARAGQPSAQPSAS